MFKKIMSTLLMLAVCATPALAQLNLTYTTFQPGQTISAAQFTANFTAISANALNRTGGTMTGTLTLNGGTDVNGSFTIGSSNLQPFDAAGKIKEISSTYFDNLSGASLTGLLEANITDGALLARWAESGTFTQAITFGTAPTMSGANITSATIPEAALADGSVYARVAANETISGEYTFTGLTYISGTTYRPLRYVISNAGVNEKIWDVSATTNVFSLSTITDAGAAGSEAFAFTRSGTTITSATITAADLTLVGNLYTQGAVQSGSAIPQFRLFESDGGPNEKYWILLSDGTALNLTAYNDAISGGSTPLQFIRSGTTVTQANITATAISLAGNTTVTGNLTVTGTLSAAFSGTFADGSLVTPSIRFTDDADTGFYRSGSGTVVVVTDGDASLSIGDVSMNYDGVFQVTRLIPNITGTDTIGTSGAYWGPVYATAFTVSSDRRLKQDIVPTKLGIEFIDALQPKEYRLISKPNEIRYGFIAQDLQKLKFYGVSVGDNGTLGLRYEDLIAPLVKGVQEVHAEVHSLDKETTARDNSLLELIKQLNNRVKVLEAQVGKRAE